MFENINYRDYGDLIIILPLGDESFLIEGIDTEIFRLLIQKKEINYIYKELKEKYKKINKKYIKNFISILIDNIYTDTNAKRIFYNSCGITDINNPLKPEISNFAVERFKKEFRKFISNGDKILDLGCNAGRFSFYLEENFQANVIGIDISETAIEYANKIVNLKNSKCKFFVADYTKLNFKNKFNVVIFPNNIVECSYNDFEQVCKGVKKSLKMGGKFILSCPLTKDYKNYLNINGKSIKKVDIPNFGELTYYSYFYNPGFINFILSKHFKIIYFKILKYTDRYGKNVQNLFFVAEKLI